ncbi:DUF2970 domain-containing protein [Catenovulum adriaticum]|uniref:DUF2970 domain-containing protein n=1 Tax=Catenovulum adriaticum TaxID=2984846 RepID=A0ABY7AL37_9ALTE|nr:DUF2970 domain-containing protein [Catenovulum sp. TS8]WAJ70267.1 DUF2970 domain-containing protein [Catenovulum sp. TS8]
MSKTLRWLEYLLSSIAALMGVQSQKNREADFKQKSAFGFLINGIVLVAIFILLLIAVVKLAISLAT